MVLELRENTFYLLWDKKNRKLFIGNYDELIDKLIDVLRDEDVENIEFLEITISEKELKATSIPWSKLVKKIVEKVKK